MTNNPIAVLDDAFARIDAAAHEAATGHNSRPEPTQAQKVAGNYKLGRFVLHGLHIAIENPRGTVRSGTDADGAAWSTTMAAHYGFIRGTKGADGDAIDCFVGPFPESTQVWVVNQRTPGEGFDEHKVMLAFHTEDQARAAYLSSYSPGWQGLMNIVPATIEQLRWWLRHGDHKKPLTAAALPYSPEDTHMDKVLWTHEAEPVGSNINRVMYDLRVHDGNAGLLLDAVTMDELLADPQIEALLTFDALVIEVGRLQPKMQVLQRVMEAAGNAVKPTEMVIGDPVKARGTLQVPVIFTMSDGQTVTIWLHNPDTTPAKLTPMDELVSWKWLINKKDVTIVVAPERGQDLNMREVARRVMKLVEKNSAAFQSKNAKVAERQAAIEALRSEIPALEQTLAGLKGKLEVARENAASKQKAAGTTAESTWSEAIGVWEAAASDRKQTESAVSFVAPDEAEIEQLRSAVAAAGIKATFKINTTPQRVNGTVTITPRSTGNPSYDGLRAFSASDFIKLTDILRSMHIGQMSSDWDVGAQKNAYMVHANRITYLFKVDTKAAEQPEPAAGLDRDAMRQVGDVGEQGGAPAANEAQPAPAEPKNGEVMAEAVPLFRSVSPEEWDAIKASGVIAGGLNTFNAFDKRREVFFALSASEGVINQGNDRTRRAEYATQQGPLQAELAPLAARLSVVEKTVEDRARELGARSYDDLDGYLKRNDKVIGPLRDEYRTLGDKVRDLQAKGRDQINRKIGEIKVADAERGYTSVLLETRPLAGGRLYTGIHSGMGKEAEVGFDSGVVKLSDVVKVTFYNGSEKVREESGAGVAEPSTAAPDPAPAAADLSTIDADLIQRAAKELFGLYEGDRIVFGTNEYGSAYSIKRGKDGVGFTREQLEAELARRAPSAPAWKSMDVGTTMTSEQYAQVKGNAEAEEHWQDALDHTFAERVVAVRNALAGLGWSTGYGRDGSQFQWPMIKSGATINADFRSVGAGKNTVAITYKVTSDGATVQVDDDLAGEPEDMAKRLDGAVKQAEAELPAAAGNWTEVNKTKLSYSRQLTSADGAENFSADLNRFGKSWINPDTGEKWASLEEAKSAIEAQADARQRTLDDEAASRATSSKPAAEQTPAEPAGLDYAFTSITDEAKALLTESPRAYGTAKALDKFAQDRGVSTAWTITSELPAAPALDSAGDGVLVLDGDFKGHPFRGNQYAFASHHSDTAAKMSRKAKQAEKLHRGKADEDQHLEQHHHAAAVSHKMAASKAKGKTKDYHDKMANFHEKRANWHVHKMTKAMDGIAHDDAQEAWPVLDDLFGLGGTKLLRGDFTVHNQPAGAVIVGGDGRAFFLDKAGEPFVAENTEERAGWVDASLDVADELLSTENIDAAADADYQARYLERTAMSRHALTVLDVLVAGGWSRGNGWAASAMLHNVKTTVGIELDEDDDGNERSVKWDVRAIIKGKVVEASMPHDPAADPKAFAVNVAAWADGVVADAIGGSDDSSGAADAWRRMATVDRHGILAAAGYASGGSLNMTGRRLASMAFSDMGAPAQEKIAKAMGVNMPAKRVSKLAARTAYDRLSNAVTDLQSQGAAERVREGSESRVVQNAAAVRALADRGWPAGEVTPGELLDKAGKLVAMVADERQKAAQAAADPAPDVKSSPASLRDSVTVSELGGGEWQVRDGKTLIGKFKVAGRRISSVKSIYNHTESTVRAAAEAAVSGRIETFDARKTAENILAEMGNKALPLYADAASMRGTGPGAMLAAMKEAGTAIYAGFGAMLLAPTPELSDAAWDRVLREALRIMSERVSAAPAADPAPQPEQQPEPTMPTETEPAPAAAPNPDADFLQSMIDGKADMADPATADKLVAIMEKYGESDPVMVDLLTRASDAMEKAVDELTASIA